MPADIKTPSELEVYVIETVQQIRSGTTVEDDLLELKRELIEPSRASRRLAGQANRANGDPILWIVGVDERTGAVHDADLNVEQWWQQVMAAFDDGVHPRLRQQLQVTLGDQERVLALLFDTEEAPYVVKLPEAGIDREIPIRSATTTRSARRHEVLAMVSRAIRAPAYSLIWAEADLWTQGEQPGSVIMKVELRTLLQPRSDALILLLADGMIVSIEALGDDGSIAFSGANESPNLAEPHERDSDSANANRLEVIEDGAYVTGPCTVQIEAGFHVPESIVFDDVHEIRVTAQVPVLEAQPIKIAAKLGGPEAGLLAHVRWHWGYP